MPTCLPNMLWTCLFTMDHAKLVVLRDWCGTQTSAYGRPGICHRLEELLRRGLQALLYLSTLRTSKKKDVLLDTGLKVGLRKVETSAPLFWAVMDRGHMAIPALRNIEQLVIEPGYQLVIQFILHCLITSQSFQPQLEDGTCLLHLVLVVGSTYSRQDQSIDLFRLYLVQHSEGVDQVCPWTGLSTLKVANRYGRYFQADQLIQLGCGAGQGEADCRPTPWLPREDPLGRLEGMVAMRQLDAVLERWSRSEAVFRQELASNVLQYTPNKGDKSEGLVIDVLMKWLKSRLNQRTEDCCSHSDCHHKQCWRHRVKLSGSLGEGSKILPVDEMDVVVMVNLDVKLVTTDKHITDSYMCSGSEAVHLELAKVCNKQPFPLLAKVMLQKGHSCLGEAGQELLPGVFLRHMEGIVRRAVEDTPLPTNLRLQEVRSLVQPMLERTKAGLMLNLEYRTEEGWQELSVDLVSVLLLDKEHINQVLRIMPERDAQKKSFLRKNNLFSNSDGIIVKNEKWRLSFSNGERKLIARHLELYQALKYLSKCSVNHISIPTYYLKEILCSFLTSNQAPKKESLALCLARLVSHTNTSAISSPFYCTRLGSHLENSCGRLFARVRHHFPQEFLMVEEHRGDW